MNTARLGRLSLPLAAALALLSVVPELSANYITSAKVVGSSSGFGQITYTPGNNVSEFLLYGRASDVADYIRSGGVNHISLGVSGNGAPGNNNTYKATTYSYSGGAPTASGTWKTTSAQWLSSYTWASISLTSPSSSYCSSPVYLEYFRVRVERPYFRSDRHSHRGSINGRRNRRDFAGIYYWESC